MDIVEWPLPLAVDAAPGAFPEVRDGTNPLERAALARTALCLGALPVRTLMRLVLWPDTVVDFAAWAGVKPPQAYNTLARRNGRPYHAVRAAYARRAGLQPEAMALIDRPRAAVPPAPPSADARDGTTALEQLALARTQTNLGAFPPGFVLQLAIWPFTEVDLAQEIDCEAQDLYNMLTFARGMRYPAIRDGVCAFTGADRAALDHLVETPRADPVPLPLPGAGS